MPRRPGRPGRPGQTNSSRNARIRGFPGQCGGGGGGPPELSETSQDHSFAHTCPARRWPGRLGRPIGVARCGQSIIAAMPLDRIRRDKGSWRVPRTPRPTTKIGTSRSMAAMDSLEEPPGAAPTARTRSALSRRRHAAARPPRHREAQRLSPGTSPVARVRVPCAARAIPRFLLRNIPSWCICRG